MNGAFWAESSDVLPEGSVAVAVITGRFEAAVKGMAKVAWPRSSRW